LRTVSGRRLETSVKIAFGIFCRHGVLVADVGEIAEGDPESDRHVVEIIEGNRPLPALDVADELPAEPGFLAESLLAERALFGQGTDTLPEDSPDVLDGACGQGTRRRSRRAEPQGAAYHVQGTLCVGQRPAPRVAHSSHKRRWPSGQ
jgi:hypothetical protein